MGRPVAQDPRVRRAYLARIRYYVYFLIADGGDRVEILALWHDSRQQGPP